ncbi:hypothetical protein AGIG_G1706 [Arapaima gigas]
MTPASEEGSTEPRRELVSRRVWPREANRSRTATADSAPRFNTLSRRREKGAERVSDPDDNAGRSGKGLRLIRKGSQSHEVVCEDVPRSAVPPAGTKRSPLLALDLCLIWRRTGDRGPGAAP